MRRSDFQDWSPAQLAFALGFVIDLRPDRGGTRAAFFVGPTGRERALSHSRACELLSRLATWRDIDPDAPPTNTPRALINGR